MLTFSVDYKKSGVYQIINKSTGLFYIGSSINIQNRLTEHFCRLRNNTHSNSHLQYAYQKYGEDSFTVSILELVADREMLQEREQAWINVTNAAKRGIGYNIAPSALDKSECSEETRQKISIASSGRVVTPEENEKRSESLKRHWAKYPHYWTGRKHTQETIAKMQVAQKVE